MSAVTDTDTADTDIQSCSRRPSRRETALDPTGLTVSEAAILPLALTLLTWSAALIVPLVIVYFAVLYSTFAGPVDVEGY